MMNDDHDGLYGSNIDRNWLAALFVGSALIYLSIYSVEAPLRWGLFLAGKDSMIFLRDTLMIAPPLLLLISQAFRLKLHPVFIISFAVIVFHGLVLLGTVGSITGVVYGAKILMNLLFGFFVAGLLIAPGKKTFRYLVVLWLVIVVGVCIEKFGFTFPWTGISTVIGGLNVDVSHDWQIDDPLTRRVAGFTRSSIAVAAILPCLTIVLLCRIKHRLIQAAIAVLGIGGVFLTTQKGSLIALIPIALILCLASERKLFRLRVAFLFFLALAIALPLLVPGLHMEHGEGVFSTQSLYLRVAYTWPEAWQWILHHQMLGLGVGLGGIGGPQRLYALNAFNPADNLIILLYAYFGVFAILYGALLCVITLRPVTGSLERVIPAVAIVAFAFGYGAVLSVVEDQSASLFLGAAIGVIWRETRVVGMVAPSWRWSSRNASYLNKAEV
jgi:hypothetical protein